MRLKRETQGAFCVLNANAKSQTRKSMKINVICAVAAVTGLRSDQNQLQDLLRRIVLAVERPDSDTGDVRHRENVVADNKRAAG